MSFDAIHGAILGTVIGDAIGLPYEALSRRRGVKLHGPPDQHRFVFGRGMMSDDGEHTCMVARALVDSENDIGRFRRSLASQLRWWLLGIPAGIGSATLRSILKLWVGVSPSRSGVFSAGNGPAMRSAIIGVAVSEHSQVPLYVRASTELTHTDPRAYHGALAIALAARCSSEGRSPGEFVALLRRELAEEENEIVSLIETAITSAGRGETTKQYADSIGCGRGVSGYVLHTVPIAIHAWSSVLTQKSARY
jgi:ADP-ribosylglycohydrolase